MITPDMIPDEVVDALWRNGYDFGGGLPAQRMKFMRAAIAAAINAWPGVNTDAVRCGTLILHLPKESRSVES